MKSLILIVACIVLFPSISFGAGGVFHNQMVRQTGIKPHKIGAYEGVGRSSVSHAAAIANACYAGQREAIHVQLSTTRNRRGQVMYNAVVQYR